MEWIQGAGEQETADWRRLILSLVEVKWWASRLRAAGVTTKGQSWN